MEDSQFLRIEEDSAISEVTQVEERMKSPSLKKKVHAPAAVEDVVDDADISCVGMELINLETTSVQGPTQPRRYC